MSVWARGALFLTAWLIYLVDRIADALSLQANAPRSARQQFCLRHKKLWLGLIPVVGLIDAATILPRLNRDVITSGACLGGVAALYLAVNYAFNEVWEVVPLKEITVGFLFSAGTLLVVDLQIRAGTVNCGTLAGAAGYVALCHFVFAQLHEYCSVGTGSGSRRSGSTRLLPDA